MSKIEEWRDSITLSGTHKVSNLGRIKRLSRRINSSYGSTRRLNERICAHAPNDGGYRRINLTHNGVMKGFLVHRMVAEAFIPNPNGLPCINHIDGNKLNNAVENLEWCTHLENMRHAHDTGLVDCKTPVCCAKNGRGQWFPSLEDAKKRTGVSKPCICAAAKKKQKTAGGMVWDYASTHKAIHEDEV